jgi:uncharacterized protein
MPVDNLDILLTVLILGAALLYSSVGHGGASGYLAAMALVAVSPAVMRPTALALNILVATIATIRFYRVGAFSWHLLWRLAAASMPFAYLGGALTLPGHIYKPLVGAVLIYAAWRSFHTASHPAPGVEGRPHGAILLVAGAALGFLSGITGVGGGIFLSPLLLFLRWAEVKVISGTAAAFILVNSVAGLLGVAASAPALPAALPYWAAAAVIGGLAGAEMGSKRLRSPTIRKILAAVLAIAGAKMAVVS